MDKEAQNSISSIVISSMTRKIDNFFCKNGEYIYKNELFSFDTWLRALRDEIDNEGCLDEFGVTIRNYDQLFLENTSHSLSDGYKNVFNNLEISNEQNRNIIEIITDLKKSLTSPNTEIENKKIFLSPKKEIKVGRFEVDCYYETCDQLICINFVTDKYPSFLLEKDRLLFSKAALKTAKPDKNILFYLGIPSTSIYKNQLQNEAKQYFSKDEILIADELWGFLAEDTNTMQQLLDIINAIATPQFMEKFDLINTPENLYTQKEAVIRVLTKWCLNDELRIMQHFDALDDDKKARKQLLKPIFLSSGEYNHSRCMSLLNHIHLLGA
jgi:hypothetical protein